MASIVFSILGAREHYAPAVMAHRAGCLDALITDFWAPSLYRWWPRSMGGAVVQRAAGRYSPDIPDDKVYALSRIGMEYRWRLGRISSAADRYALYELMGARFASAACAFLAETQDVFWGYSSASLETIRAAKRHGLHTIVDQIDPGRVEYDLVADEHRRFPALSPAMPVPPDRYFGRVEEEWDTAATVVVNSEWSRSALVAQGVHADKIRVVPLAYEQRSHATPRAEWKKELKVLWLGTLCLRKGFPYATEAAKLLQQSPVRFTFAGPCDLNRSAMNLPPNAEYIGPVARRDAANLYARHDIFIFPTLSDGFGLTQVEAMASGLPVIATNCCAEVVEDGTSGIVVPARDAHALAAAIEQFVSDPLLLPGMSGNALVRSCSFSTSAVWARLAQAIEREPVLQPQVNEESHCP